MVNKINDMLMHSEENTKMNSKVYKWCAVPKCKNTTYTTPNKVFVYVPHNKKIRDKWFQLARRNPKDVSLASINHFCEDHFDLPNDMENYMEYHVMGSVSKVRITPGCLPKKFICQTDRTTRQRSKSLQECEKYFEGKNMVTEHSSSEDIASSSSAQQNVEDITQWEMIEDDKRREDLKALECTLKRIKRSPRSFIGIALSCYYLVNLIQEQTSIPLNHILLCLKKIRLNNSFLELGHDFGIHQNYARNIFFKNIPVIASVLGTFLVTLNKELIKRKLPVPFRRKYNKVTCIIDCLEIEIQKPSKATNQALTWSDNKKANTIKYLISCTPNGLINYISNGYGGKITDTCIVETSDFSKCLQPNMGVMANKGFNVEVYLGKMGVLLVRPPSVVSGAKLLKAQAKETKQKGLGSLQIMDRVITRLREFNMLQPNACLDLSLVNVIDDVITIACGLVNIHSSFIK